MLIIGEPPSLTTIPAIGEISALSSPYARMIKRPLDALSVLATSPIVVPLVLILVICLMVTGGRPFYTQLRVGRRGESFRIWKLRTMVADADARLQAHLETDAAAKTEWNLTQKLKRDPRITSFGQFLRKSSLDELPQLWNVLIGDMSIVGPRPMMVEQARLYPGAEYYHLRPGITGLWQVSDRNDSAFAARATFDARYANELSWRSDLAILRKTVGVVFRCTGY